MDENPYAEQNYKPQKLQNPQKPQKPKKSGKIFGMISVTFGMITWGFYVIMSIVSCSVFLVFTDEEAVGVCVILAILTIVFGAIHKMFYEKTKMADIGMAMGILFPIFLLIDMALGLLFVICSIIYLVITGSW